MATLAQRLTGGRKAFTVVRAPEWATLGGSWAHGDAWGDWGSSAPDDFQGHVDDVYRANGPVFACIAVRQLLFSEARLQWRKFADGRPGDMFGDEQLALLDRPYPGGTTGSLLARAELDASLAGNSYMTVVDDSGAVGRNATGPGRRIVRMRPDWVTVITGSRSGSKTALDARVIGYLYRVPGSPDDDRLIPAEDVAHYAPMPDPGARWRGMSWLTPVLREIEGDLAATVHKGRFFKNGAAPAMTVTVDKQVRPADFERFKELFEAQHKGAENAYKTLFLGGGADAKPMTMDMRQLDFRQTQGAGETRIAAAAGVPPVIVGLSEGLQSATYSNYGQARRRFADGTMRPLWRMVSASLEALLTPPPGASLWYDDRDIAFLQEDQKDAADITQVRAQTIARLSDAGFTPPSVIAAVLADDFTLLQHGGLFSVQLQPPGTTANGSPPALPPGGTP